MKRCFELRWGHAQTACPLDKGCIPLNGTKTQRGVGALPAIGPHHARTERRHGGGASDAYLLHRGDAAGTFPAPMRSAGSIPPVLCYHRIGGPPELGVTRVARSVFARQMHALARAGWRTVTLGEFVTRVHGRGAASPDEFLLSFDDGYASLADHAYPVLADVGFTATRFLVTDFIGRTNTWDMRYTWRRLRHLDWNAIEHWHGRGFEFASHTASHTRLTWLADERIADELGR